ncbi:hypothetical protein [Pseudanabaena sp. PCC 6802]|uniref:hypothetical protein n=1 Tax=Pseudanabaena sp. PCC 6802 TaxID=118173 RepID=UPI0003492ED0|nr:hypothetical protein [Pseudanabaena sp. PCC 6802]
MSRTFSQFARDKEKQLLATLVDPQSNVELYRKCMYELGESLGDLVLTEIKDRTEGAYLACTAEDADFLAKGMLSKLETSLAKVTLACFWNQRFAPFGISDLQVAPILKRYLEPTTTQVNSLIIVKSIISGACVVRTNLLDTIERITPQTIFVVAPAIFKGAEKRLQKGFPESIYKKFRYIYLAEDDERTPEGVVIPGIGGMVYNRLGFNSQADKNHYVPDLVRQRRAALAIGI